MLKYTSAEDRVPKNQKMTVCHFGFTEKVYGLPCAVRTATVAMPKWWMVLSHTNRDPRHKKASRCKENSAQQMQASLNFVLMYYSEYPCNSSWPTVASSYLWDARESSWTASTDQAGAYARRHVYGGCYRYKCRCYCSEYPCNSAWAPFAMTNSSLCGPESPAE